MITKRDEIVIVTGGSRGIGRAICLRMALAGYQVVFTYKANEELAEKLIQEVRKELNINIVGCKCDMAEEEEVKNFFYWFKMNFKRLDILINNAGILGENLPFLITEHDDWWKTVRINMACVTNTCRFAIPMMIAGKKGKIINITSLAGQKGSPGQTAYSASKAATVAFTKSLSKELGALGISFNCVSPGFIETDMTKELNSDFHQSSIARSPLKRMGRPSEVADLVYFLCAQSTYILAQDIVIDGGIGS